MVDAQTCINGQPFMDILAEVYVSSYLVAMRFAALFVGGIENLTCLLRRVISLTVDMLIVNSYG